jgi:hypothetical protein
MLEIVGGVREYVCSLLGGDEHKDANARLIAKAPEMVEALRDALPILEEAETLEWEEGGPEVLPQAEAVRALLREIDGGENA